MKLINLMACGALALVGVSCTSSDVIDDVLSSEVNRIGFTTNVSKNSRAVTNDNFNRFFVYATYSLPTQPHPVNVFNGDLVSKGDAGWTYSGDRYWVPEGSYDFYAYSCDNQQMNPNVGGTAAFNQRVLRINGFVSNANHQHDLLFAKTLGQTRTPHVDGVTPPQVAFRFSHVLTRVIFTFKSSYPSGYTITVSNPRVINFCDTGDFNGETETWEDVTRSDENVTLSLSLKNGIADITSTPVSTAPIYMIPFMYNRANVLLEFEVHVKKDGEDVLGRTITATWQPQWAAGHSLNNEITITGGRTGLDPIRFSASIVGSEGSNEDGWKDESGNLSGIVFEAH